jgi:hypothetical protein
MGVERAVTRWYIQRQNILNEIAQLEAQLAQTPQTSTTIIEENNTDTLIYTQEQTISLNTNTEEIHQQLAKAQQKLHLLGPCPKPMMG